VSQVLTKPVLIVLMISSVASLLTSALITVHLRRPPGLTQLTHFSTRKK
jgi:hypothetical protein